METSRNQNVVDLESIGFQLQFEDRWSRVSYDIEKKIIICELLVDYVPIEHFKSTFQQVSDTVKNGDFTKFIFDKRSLRTFHQPTMEWYFITWKQEMIDYGLTKHRKILPELDWFKTAVQIERNKLMGKLKAATLERLDIKYCQDISQAIDM